jgi:hypothetical protein
MKQSLDESGDSAGQLRSQVPWKPTFSITASTSENSISRFYDPDLAQALHEIYLKIPVQEDIERMSPKPRLANHQVQL